MAEADKQELHQLVESLPIKEIKAAKRFLEFLLSRTGEEDPVLDALLSTPEDEEPLETLEIAGIREGMLDIEQGATRSWKQAKEEMGRQ